MAGVQFSLDRQQVCKREVTWQSDPMFEVTVLGESETAILVRLALGIAVVKEDVQDTGEELTGRKRRRMTQDKGDLK